MSEVLSGDFDLRVPVVTAVVDSYTQLSVSDVIVELVVSRGREVGTAHLRRACSSVSVLGRFLGCLVRCCGGSFGCGSLHRSFLRACRPSTLGAGRSGETWMEFLPAAQQQC